LDAAEVLLDARAAASFAELVAARISGAQPDPLAAQVPSLRDGLASLEFIEACLLSSSKGSWAQVPL
jgi:predicted dehydrogenase